MLHTAGEKIVGRRIVRSSRREGGAGSRTSVRSPDAERIDVVVDCIDVLL